MIRFKYLYNPFERIAGFMALCVGVGALLLTAFINSNTGTHITGFTQLQFAKDAPFWLYTSELLSGWLVFAILISALSFIKRPLHFRLIDVFGTLLMARMPFVLVGVLRVLPTFQSFMVKSWAMYFLQGVFVLSLVWALVLSFNAVKISVNIKGKTLGFTVGIALLLAEIANWFIIQFLTYKI